LNKKRFNGAGEKKERKWIIKCYALQGAKKFSLVVR